MSIKKPCVFIQAPEVAERTASGGAWTQAACQPVDNAGKCSAGVKQRVYSPSCPIPAATRKGSLAAVVGNLGLVPCRGTELALDAPRQRRIAYNVASPANIAATRLSVIAYDADASHQSRPDRHGNGRHRR